VGGVLREGVLPDDQPLLPLDLELELVGGVLDLALRVALLDRAHHAAELSDSGEVLLRVALDAVGERLDGV